MYVIGPNYRTNLDWWDGMSRRDNSIVLTMSEDEEKTLLIAECENEEKAIELFKAINEGIRLKKRNFKLIEWEEQYEQVAV